jgi:SAM-dependent methyltransferase
MSHRGLENNQLLDLIPENLHTDSILDLGAGYGFWGWAIKTHKKGNPRLTGLDVFPNYIEKLHTLGIYDEVIKHDLTNGIPYPDRSFDITIASHVIEHLPKDNGFYLIKEMERVTRKLIIISCPCGESRASPTDSNPYYSHKAEWFEHDFLNLGYRTQIVTRKLGKIPDLIFSWHQKIRGRPSAPSVILAHKLISEE